MTQVTFTNTKEKLYTSELSIYLRGPREMRMKGFDETREANKVDSLFYYTFVDERGIYDVNTEYFNVIDNSAYKLIDNIIRDNADVTTIAMNQIPNWQDVRDNTITVSVGMKNPTDVLRQLWNSHGEYTLFLSNCAIDQPTGGWQSRANQEEQFYDIYNLFDLINHQQDIVLRSLDRNVSQMDAMRILIDPLDTVYQSGVGIKLGDGEAVAVDDGDEDPEGPPCPDHHKQYYGYSNWFIKARALSIALWDNYPVNFRNIVIHGASKMIAQDKLKLTKLQQFLAACGRLDTKIILVD